MSLAATARPEQSPPKPAARASAPMAGVQLVLATLALGLGSFMNILDLSIANVSVPHIAGDLGVSPTQGTWVVTSYAVAEAIMLPLTGWLSMRFGQVRMFVAATALFTLASVACGLAPSFPMLLAARVAQGAMGASMIPLTQTLMTSIYPPQKRGLALGLWSMTTVIAPIAGPLAGGWLTDNYSWHWIFLVNAPVGMLVGGLAWTLLRQRETPVRKMPVDYVGLALLIIGVGALQILLDKGNELDWFGSRVIVVLACVSAIALACLVAWELTDEHPVIDLRLFARRNFLVGVTCLFFGTMAFFGTVVILPLWLQQYQGYTALAAGQAIALGGVFAVILGPVVGANLGRLDARAVATFGFLVFGVVALWSSRFTPDVDFWSVAQTRLYMGIGISCFFLPIITINLSGLSPERIAAASGLSNFVRNLGSSFGTAIVTSTWAHRGSFHHAALAEHVTEYSSTASGYIDQLQAAGATRDAALAHLDQLLNVQSYLMATNDILWASGVLLLVLAPLIWLARPPFVVKSPAGH
jgi:DHA2 family multidrug resistance protein